MTTIPEIAPPPVSRINLSRWIVAAAVLVAAAAFSFNLLRHHYLAGANYLANLEATARQEENAGLASLTKRLRVINGQDSAAVLAVSISAPVVQKILKQFEGSTFHLHEKALGDVEVRLQTLEVEFRDGFPRVRGNGTITARGQTVKIETLAAFRPVLTPGTVQLRINCLGLAPVGTGLPHWAEIIAKSSSTRAVNAELEKQPISVPLQNELELNFGLPATIQQWVKTDNGRVQIQINLPAIPSLKRWIQPREVFFTRDGLHILASLSKIKPQEIGFPLSPVASATTVDSADDQLAPWRLLPEQSLRAEIGRDIILGILSEAHSWSEASPTITFHGIGAEGHLKDTTGGAPFGNGFGAWLDGPERLKGSFTLQSLAPVWQPDTQRLVLKAKASAEGSVQVHVHGNATHIGPPKIFGRRIGGGVTIGGGVGTGVGATVHPDSYDLTGAVQLNPETAAFEVRLLDPADLTFKVDIGGVPNELERLFKLGFKVPLPRDKALYTFSVPPLLSKSFNVPLPENLGGPKQLDIEADQMKAAMTPDGLRLSGSLRISPLHGKPPGTRLDQ